MSPPTEKTGRPSTNHSTNTSSPGPSSHPNTPSHPHPKAEHPPPPQQAPDPSFVDRIPSIRLSVPPRGVFQSHSFSSTSSMTTGRFSPATSERCFTYCSQSHFGRAHGNEPKCYTLCLRRIFNHEVNRVLTNVNYGPIIKSPAVSANIPLPPEANTTLRQYISDSAHAEDSDDSAPSSHTTTSQHPENHRHWQENYYVWLSRSRQAASEHMSHMKRDLFQQSAYEHSKALWAKAVREGKQHEFYRTPEAHIFGSEWTANMHEDILCVASPAFSRSPSMLRLCPVLHHIVGCCFRCPRQLQSLGVSYLNTLPQRPLFLLHFANRSRPVIKPSSRIGCVSPYRKARRGRLQGMWGGRFGVCYRARVMGR